MRLTVESVAALTGGEVFGDPNFVLDGVSGIDNSSPTQLTFLADINKASMLTGCKAGCVLMPKAAKGKDLEYKGNIIYSDNPHWSFVLILRQIQLERRPKKGWGVHPTAVVDPTARLGKYVHIGPHCVIEKDAVVGDFSTIYPNCFIGERAQVGKNCLLYPGVVLRDDCVVRDRVIIHPNAVIGADGFGYMHMENRHEKIPQLGRVIIEDDVEIGALTAIDRAALEETRIGAGTKIDNLVQIAHNVKIGKACIVVSQAGIAGSSSLGDGVVVAGQVGIVDHVNIGSRAVITAGTGIMSDVEPGAIMFGVPARPHREALKIQAIIGKLPQIYSTIKLIKKKLKLED